MSAEETNEPLLLLSDNKAGCNADVEDGNHIPAHLVSVKFSLSNFLGLGLVVLPCVLCLVLCLLFSVRANNIHHHLDLDLDLDLDHVTLTLTSTLTLILTMTLTLTLT